MLGDMFPVYSNDNSDIYKRLLEETMLYV